MFVAVWLAVGIALWFVGVFPDLDNDPAGIHLLTFLACIIFGPFLIGAYVLIAVAAFFVDLLAGI